MLRCPSSPPVWGGMDWRGKRVIIAGMGAFAVENVRTALEQGAAEVGQRLDLGHVQ